MQAMFMEINRLLGCDWRKEDVGFQMSDFRGGRVVQAAGPFNCPVADLTAGGGIPRRTQFLGPPDHVGPYAKSELHLPLHTHAVDIPGGGDSRPVYLRMPQQQLLSEPPRCLRYDLQCANYRVESFGRREKL
jgi:hypothetical protein